MRQPPIPHPHEKRGGARLPTDAEVWRYVRRHPWRVALLAVAVFVAGAVKGALQREGYLP